MITLTTHFTGNINIANTSSSYSEGEALAGFISKYEPMFLKDVLGYTLYNLFTTNIAQTSGIYYDLLNGAAYTDSNSVATYWDGFILGHNPIANFIWVKYQEDLYLQNTSMGIMQVKGENMANINPSYKIAKAWDEMVDWLWKLHDFLTVNKADYPDYIGLTYAPYNKNLTNGYYNYPLLSNTYTMQQSNNKYFQYRPRL